MRILTRLMFGALWLAAGATPVTAQTAPTFEACYVPDVGAIYLINRPGLPSACLASTHIAISWTAGGVPDSTVTEANLAFDPATQAELDALIAGLTTAGTVNATSNPVDWTQLKNVPADFADGTDNSGGTPSDLVCTACVETTDLAASAVTGAQLATGVVVEGHLAFDPTTQTEHDTYATGVAAAGTINTTGNPVDWTQLKNVPADFADGVDATGGGVTDHAALTGLANDDHPQYLLAGVRDTPNGFAVTGTLNSGTIPASGPGVRLIWYPGKAAFRAGLASGSSWDDANVGTGSVAFGSVTTASGPFSTAMGAETTASGASSTAMGVETTASGTASTAMGSQTTASGDQSTAMGDATTASGGYSTAMGSGTAAIGTRSTAMGSGTRAGGSRSTAMGDNTLANGPSSTAMGIGTRAGGSFSTAMGLNTFASGSHSTAMGGQTNASGTATTSMGTRTSAQAYASVAIGRFNTVTGNQISWDAADPLLVAGNGANDGSRSNALTLFKNGNLTIAGGYSQSSDIRLKENIRPVTRALDGVLSLAPIRYRFRDGTGHPRQPQIGLSAQEVERAFPELVSRDTEGYLSVAYPNLTAVLVRAVQEQQEQLETQSAQIHDQQEQLAEQRTQFAAQLESLREEMASLRSALSGRGPRR